MFHKIAALTVALFLIGLAAPAGAQDLPVIPAVLETAPSAGDGATAPAIWLHPLDVSKSLIIGADDNLGIIAYDLAGVPVQTLEIGSVLATDVRYNVALGRARVTLIAAAIEDQSAVFFYTVDEETRELEQVGQIDTGVRHSGVCFYQSPVTDRLYVFALGQDGEGQQILLDTTTGEIASRVIRSFNVGNETEGCAADDDYRALYVSEGAGVLWRYGAEPEAGTDRAIVDLLVPRGYITEEIEGVAIIKGAEGSGYVMVSNEKNHSYLLFERRGRNAYVGEFGLTLDGDAVTEPTGFAAVTLPMGEAFPNGLFVTSDDRNSQPTDNNNFKLASWADVEAALNLPALLPADIRAGEQVVSGGPVVTAALETAPAPSTIDAADDPAVWIHPTDLALTTIIGTDKTSGLVVYNLDGTILQAVDIGRVNNVDLRYNFMLNGVPVAVVATTNRTTNSLSLFTVNPETRLLEPAAARLIESAVEEVYGLCMYVSPNDGQHYVFVNSADTGEVEQYRLLATDDGKIDAEVVRTFTVGSQTEGCVVDDANATLYIGEEAVGLWKYGAEPSDDDTRTQIDNTTAEGHLTADVEGVALYATADGGGYVVVSSQGSSEFAVYERLGENAYIGSFSVIEGENADGISGTDGIEVISFGLGAAFPDGVFIAQDDRNIDPDQNQNFKIVAWPAIAEALGLTVDNTVDPRLVDAE